MDLRNKTTENFSTELPYLALVRQLGLVSTCANAGWYKLQNRLKSILRQPEPVWSKSEWIAPFYFEVWYSPNQGRFKTSGGKFEGDIRDLETCHNACDDPIHTNESNLTGFLNMLVAARDRGVKRFVYAASSAAYGDDPGLPQVEEKIGSPLSPYGVTKHADELHANVFERCYTMETIGLRYFTPFGPRQDQDGAYAAVIPKSISAMADRLA